ncbi:MAG: hypothetical protein DMF60_17750 [Acidobacteria bacterium]|nr:MAG: hypothetical protein DMF60_17750 [Acidobacteriota bacterium]
MTRFIKLTAVLSLAACLYIGTVMPKASMNSLQSPCAVNLTTGYNVPHDLSPNASLTDLECFAWQSFIALNWPAVTQNWMQNTRGVPDQTQNFGASGTNNFAGNLVWETYKHKVELFPATGAPPQSYDTKPNYVYSAKVTVPQGVNGSLFNNLDEGTEIDQNYMFFPKNPPKPSSTGKSITPNQDHQILFEARANRVEYNYVVSNQYYNATIAAKAATNTVNYLSNPSTPPQPPFISFPAGDMSQSDPSFEGAIETKAAWRILTADEVASGRYHTASAVYYSGTDSRPVAQNATFGLLALHIIHKTRNYPYFIFATFEQEDALKLVNGNPTGLYFITTYPKVTYLDNNNQPTAPPSPPPMFPNGILPAAQGLPVGLAGPTVVSQYTAASPVTQQVNDAVHAQIINQNPASVWQYYKLLGVQAVPTSNNQSPYFYLANVVVESSLPGLQLFQGRIPGPKPPPSLPFPLPLGFPPARAQNNTFVVNGTTSTMVNMGGCMGCHAVPQRTGYDFSFILKGGPVGTPDAAGIPTTPSAARLRVLRVARQFVEKPAR